MVHIIYVNERSQHRFYTGSRCSGEHFHWFSFLCGGLWLDASTWEILHFVRLSFYPWRNLRKTRQRCFTSSQQSWDQFILFLTVDQRSERIRAECKVSVKVKPFKLHSDIVSLCAEGHLYRRTCMFTHRMRRGFASDEERMNCYFYTCSFSVHVFNSL